MSTRSALITVMHKASMAASRRMMRDFGEVENLQVSRKGLLISSLRLISLQKILSVRSLKKHVRDGALLWKRLAKSRLRQRMHLSGLSTRLMAPPISCMVSRILQSLLR